MALTSEDFIRGLKLLLDSFRHPTGFAFDAYQKEVLIRHTRRLAPDKLLVIMTDGSEHILTATTGNGG